MTVARGWSDVRFLGHEPRNAGGPSKLKKVRKCILLSEPLKGTSPAETLTLFSSVRLILHF